MRFGLKCLVTLAILYRAILVSGGGTETAALSSGLGDAAATAQSRIRDAIATQVGAVCRRDPATCLSETARLAALVTPDETGDPVPPRQHRHGAIAAPTR